MKFLYPEFLWALLVLLIPIIIHLFNFKRYKTLYFSSLKFIKSVDQRTKSTQRLKNILILISRILAFTFLVFAFAQPYISSEEEDTTPNTNITCIYIDNSYSMQALGPEGELLSEAREKAREIVEKAPVDALFIIGTNEMTGREEHLLNKADAFDKIDHIEPSPLSRSISDILNWQEGIIDGTSGDSKKSAIQYILFSDFQKGTQPMSERAKSDLKYFPVQMVPENTDNLYIDSVWFESVLRKVNNNNQISVRIVNNSNTAKDNVELNISIGELRKTIFVDVQANAEEVATFSYMDKKSGFISARVSISDRQVFFDDIYYFSYEVRDRSNILIIDGEDAVDNIKLAYSLDDYYEIRSKNITSLTIEDFSNADLILLNGVNGLSSGIQTYLNDYLLTGGSVALFPGTEPNENEWTSFLSQHKMPGIGSSISSGTKIKELNYQDPFFKGTFDKETKNLNLPSVSKVFRSINRNSLATNVITLQNGEPLLSYRSGNNNIFMFYSSLDSRFGNFTRDALFTTILYRMAELSQRKQPLSVTIGENTLYPVYRKVDRQRAVKVQNNNHEFIPQLTEKAGVTYLVLNKQDNQGKLSVGNFDIVQDERIGVISLNNNRIESQLESYSEDEIKSLFGTENSDRVELNEMSSESSFSSRNIDKPMSYWKICIIITLIFVIAEMLLVRLLR